MNDLRNWLLGALRVLSTPSCWIQNETYSRQWDRKLNQLLALHRFESITTHTALIGGVEIWIENHPYASFTPQNGISCRPKRITILRAYDKLLEQIYAPDREVDELERMLRK